MFQTTDPSERSQMRTQRSGPAVRNTPAPRRRASKKQAALAKANANAAAPGTVMMSPQMATISPAPAEVRISRTFTVWPVGTPFALASVESEYLPAATHVRVCCS
jgi:hypothetical protein